TETQAKLLAGPGGSGHKLVPSTSMKVGDVVLVEAGDTIPSDGEVIEGIATVNEAAITGESAPVIRESGGDRSAVTGGTQVLSDWIVVRITAAPGSTFLDRMIRLVEGAERQKTPNEFRPLRGTTEQELADAAQLASLADETPEGRSIVVLAKEKYGIRGRDLAELRGKFIPFTAQSRMSGMEVGQSWVRKGAVDAILGFLNASDTVVV